MAGLVPAIDVLPAVIGQAFDCPSLRGAAEPTGPRGAWPDDKFRGVRVRQRRHNGRSAREGASEHLLAWISEDQDVEPEQEGFYDEYCKKANRSLID